MGGRSPLPRVGDQANSGSLPGDSDTSRTMGLPAGPIRGISAWGISATDETSALGRIATVVNRPQTDVSCASHLPDRLGQRTGILEKRTQSKHFPGDLAELAQVPPRQTMKATNGCSQWPDTRRGSGNIRGTGHCARSSPGWFRDDRRGIDHPA